MRHLIATIAAASLACLAANAQDWTGRVTDADGMPLEAASVCLKSPADSSILAYALADKEGLFSIGCGTSPVILSISYIGYVTVERLCSGRNIGTVAMELDAQTMEAAVVKAGRAVQKLTPEGMETLVAGSTLERAGSASDVLKKVPGIIWKDNSYDVYGKGAPVIYINGRIMRDASELDRITSEDIRSIEVISNPGARYDASVKAVVKIFTKKKQGDGLSFDLMGGFQEGKHSSYDGSANWNYRTGGLDIFGTLSAGRSRFAGESGSEMTIHADTLWQQNFTQEFEQQNNSAAVTLGANYVFDDFNSAGFRYNLGTALAEGSSFGNVYNEVFADGAFYDKLVNTVNETTPVDYSHSVNAYYHGRVGKVEVDLNADYTHSSPETVNHYLEHSTSYEDQDFTTTSRSTSDLAAAKLVLSYPLFGGQLSAGAEYTNTARKDDYITTGVLDGAANELYESNIGPFVEYSHALPFGQLLAGLRYEHVSFSYYEAGVRKDNQCRTFGNLFPSVNLVGMAGGVQFSLGYSAKTSRPSYSQLSNTMVYGNRFLWQSGNPYLKHEYIHDISANAVWKFFQLAVDYTDTRDAIFTTVSQVSEETSSVQYVTFDNIKSLKALTLNLYATPHIGIWSGTIGGQMRKQWLDVDYLGGKMKMNNPLCNLVCYNDFNLGKGWIASAGGFVIFKDGDVMNIRIGNTYGSVNASVTKLLLDGRMSIKLGVDDIFKGLAQGVYNYCGMENLYQFSSFDSRRLTLSVKYNFNTARSKYRGTGAGNDEKKRL